MKTFELISNLQKIIQLLGKLGYYYGTNKGPVEFVSKTSQHESCGMGTSPLPGEQTAPLTVGWLARPPVRPSARPSVRASVWKNYRYDFYTNRAKLMNLCF